jgi:hypothetical protein
MKACDYESNNLSNQSGGYVNNSNEIQIQPKAPSDD